MPFVHAILALLVLFAAGPLPAQQAAYPPVRASTPLAFPRDHGAHPAYRVEWWYLTGWLEAAEPDAAGPTPPARGFQLTFFRLRPGVQEANRSAFAPTQLLFGHAAVSDPAHGRLRHAERSARTGFGLAFADEGDTRVAIDDWTLRRQTIEGRETYVAEARGEDFAYRLVARAAGPPLLQGEDEKTPGFSRKGREMRHASHYYSRPQLAVEGTLSLGGSTRRVTGRAWLDHEWSSEAMPEGAVGWDWLGANLHDGGALTAFRLRDAADRTLWAGGTLQRPGQPIRRFNPDEIRFVPIRRWRSPRTGGDYAVEMTVGAANERWRLVPLFDDQELDARGSVGAVYWEGAVTLFAETHPPPNGGAAALRREIGRGYLEMTGVVGKLRM